MRRHDVLLYSWIPVCFAVKGRYLRLKGEDGWRVEEPFGTCTETQIRNIQYSARNTRKHSDR